jgi:hypothetical protein
MALMLVTLLGFAGFAVDVGHWYLTANRAQRAADAGALGGVAMMPGDLAGATVTATELGEGNGFEPGDVTVQAGSRPNQLRVTVEDTVDNYFAGLFGVGSTTITRTALAEFQGSSVMGSPSNWLGNNTDPSSNAPDFWLMNAGFGSPPINGDRFQAGNGSTEYDPDGYTFKVDVRNVPAAGPLRIEAFDPIHVDVGFTSCGRLPTAAENTQLASDHPGMYGLGGTYTPVDGDATFRYAPGRWDRVNFPYCTADNGSVEVTTFIVREPDDTPLTDLDNPIIDNASCAPRQYEGFSDTNGTVAGVGTKVHGYLDPDDGWRDSDHAQFAGAFRQWVILCEIPNGSVEVGEYIVQVRTNSPLGDPEGTSGPAGNGLNKYALRVGFGAGTSVNSGSDVTVAASGRLPMFVGAIAANTNFYLTRVPPVSNGSFLEVTFWDVGDGAGSGHIQVLPPDEYLNSDGTYGPAGTNYFDNCVWEDTIGSTSGVPDANCELDDVNGSFNGDLVTAFVPIPANYDCDTSSPVGCWVTLRFQWDAGADVFDHTVWGAGLSGDPVRLVE